MVFFLRRCSVFFFVLVAPAPLSGAVCSLPKGTLERPLSGLAAEAHAGVLDAMRAEGDVGVACERRRGLLRELVELGSFDEAVELSFALEPFREGLPEACDDRPFAGSADVFATHAAWKNVANSHVRQVTALFQDKTKVSLLSSAIRFRVSSLDAPVVGAFFSLSDANTKGQFGATKENVFFVALEAAIRCTMDKDGRFLCGNVIFESRDEVCAYGESLIVASAKKKKSLLRKENHAKNLPKRVLDETSTYVVGAKKVLVIPVCPRDVENCDAAYDYGLVESSHAGSLNAFLEQVMTLNARFFQESSWGALSMTWSVTPIVRIDYDAANCGSVEGLGYYYDDGSAYDVMAFAAAEEAGYARSDYDFHVVVSPRCASLGWSGIGWVGYPGCVLNLNAQNYDQSLAHELGHNFGANHASFDEYARGAVAWWDETLGEVSTTWREYANPFTVMGNADVSFDDSRTGQFLVAGRLVFDWITASDVVEVDVYEKTTAGVEGLCYPDNCGPYYLQAIDDEGGLRHEGIPLALQLSTRTAQRYLFLEFRSSSFSVSGLLLTWSDIFYGSGFTGTYGNTLMADTSPETTSLSDGLLGLGESYDVDLGLEAKPGLYVATIDVAPNLSSDGYIVVSLRSSTTAAPTSTGAPTTADPTNAPTTRDDLCEVRGDNTCCDTFTLPVYAEGQAHTFEKLVPTACCSERCSYYEPRLGRYLHYVDYWGDYFATDSAPCFTEGILSYHFSLSPAQVGNYCSASAPAPTLSPAPSNEPTSAAPTKAPITPTPMPSALPTPPPSAMPFSAVTGLFSFIGLALADASANSNVFVHLLERLARIEQSADTTVDVTIVGTPRRLLSMNVAWVAQDNITTLSPQQNHRKALAATSIAVHYSIALPTVEAHATATRLTNATLADIDDALAAVLADLATSALDTAFRNAAADSTIAATVIDLTAAPTTTSSETKKKDNSGTPGLGAPMTILIIVAAALTFLFISACCAALLLRPYSVNASKVHAQVPPEISSQAPEEKPNTVRAWPSPSKESTQGKPHFSKVHAAPPPAEETHGKTHVSSKTNLAKVHAASPPDDGKPHVRGSRTK